MPMKFENGSPLWGSPKDIKRRVSLWRIAWGVMAGAGLVVGAYALAKVVI